MPLAAAVSSLLAAWLAAGPPRCGHGDGGSGGCEGGARAGGLPWWVVTLDLPAALLQHPAVQLAGLGPQVLAAVLPGPPLTPRQHLAAASESAMTDGAGAGSHKQQGPSQQQLCSEQRRQQGGAAGRSSAPSPRDPPEGQRLVAAAVRGQALDALEALSGAAAELALIKALPLAQPCASGQAQAGGAARGGGGARRSWLAGCVRHVLLSGALPLDGGSRGVAAITPGAAGACGTQQAPGGGQQGRSSLVPQLQRLLQAVEACRAALGSVCADGGSA
jgi:hypothetical protein